MKHLPPEILGIIIEATISEHAGVGRRNEDDLLPAWFLVPLLRVCKAWYPLVEQHLYRSISVGDKFPHRIAEIKDERTTGETSVRVRNPPKTDNKNRSGRKIAEDLLLTLERNARLAGLVRELRLGVDSEPWSEPANAELTRMSTRILKLCPNVGQVMIRDFDRSESDAVVAALKEKTLVSFCSSHWDPCLDSSQILQLMQNWTQLRHIEIMEQWSSSKFSRELLAFDTTVPTLCPNLHTLILRDGHITDDVMLSALIKHFSAWSSTLVCIKLNIRNNGPVNQHFPKAFSSLKCLRQLQAYGMELDMATLSDLPRLEILAFDGFDKQVESLIKCLENMDKFTVLNLVSIMYGCHLEVLERLEDVCSGRKIRVTDPSGYFAAAAIT